MKPEQSFIDKVYPRGGAAFYFLRKIAGANFSGFMICIFLIGINANSSFAQDSVYVGKKPQFIIQPYLMFPTMDGSVGLGTLPNADIHANAGDIFSHLQIGAMLYAEYNNEKWAFSSDMIYMDLSQDIEGKRGIINGEAGAKQFVWELAGLRRLKPWLEAGIGARVLNIQSSLDINVDATVPGGPGHRSRSISETWIDPVLIARAKFPVGIKWLFQVRGDLGGFGIGSKFTWQVQADASYQIAKWFRLGLGYRFIGVDYEKGSGNNRFLYDVNTFGPVLRLGFQF